MINYEKNNGFTIIELMIVIAIIAILAAAVIPVFKENINENQQQVIISKVIITKDDMGVFKFTGITTDGVEVTLTAEEFANLPDDVIIVK